MSSDLIRLNNMTFHAYHGVWDEEREIGQRFEVDVELAFDVRRATKTDKLRDTVDLYAVFEQVEEVIEGGKYRLVETMAEHIAQRILDKFDVDQVLVRVRKPHAPIRGIQDGIEVQIKRTKEKPIT